MRAFINAYRRIGLVPAIIIALVLGTLLGWLIPSAGLAVGILGDLFVGALKAVAPVLVFVLVLAAVCNHRTGGSNVYIKPVLLLYLIGTFMAALTAVLASFAVPVELVGLLDAETVDKAAPQTLKEVLTTLLMNLVANPVGSLVNANYMGILTWAVLLGFALRHAQDSTKALVGDLSDGVTQVVRWVVALAPFGIFGLVANTIATTGFAALASYGKLLFVLVGCMLFIAFVGNAIIVYAKTRKNPYPLIIACLRESGITAFFTRSSAANIPVNMNLARKLGVGLV